MDTEKTKQENEKVHCTAFCPKCGTDLFIMGKECMCKNKECSWSCGGCAEDEK